MKQGQQRRRVGARLRAMVKRVGWGPTRKRRASPPGEPAPRKSAMPQARGGGAHGSRDVAPTATGPRDDRRFATPRRSGAQLEVICEAMRRALAADIGRSGDGRLLDRLQPPDVVWLRLRTPAAARRHRQQPAPAAAGYNKPCCALAAALVLTVGASCTSCCRSSLPTAARSAAAATGSRRPDRRPTWPSRASRRRSGSPSSTTRTRSRNSSRPRSSIRPPATRMQIDPQTAETLQKNLKVIDQAIAESRAAVRSR